MYHHGGKAEIQKLIARHLFKCFKMKKEKEGKKETIYIYWISLQNGGVPVGIRLQKKFCLFLSSTAMSVCTRFGMAL